MSVEEWPVTPKEKGPKSADLFQSLGVIVAFCWVVIPILGLIAMGTVAICAKGYEILAPWFGLPVWGW